MWIFARKRCALLFDSSLHAWSQSCCVICVMTSNTSNVGSQKVPLQTTESSSSMNCHNPSPSRYSSIQDTHHARWDHHMGIHCQSEASSCNVCTTSWIDVLAGPWDGISTTKPHTGEYIHHGDPTWRDSCVLNATPVWNNTLPCEMHAAKKWVSQYRVSSMLMSDSFVNALFNLARPQQECMLHVHCIKVGGSLKKLVKVHMLIKLRNVITSRSGRRPGLW